ncbi:hypothetical protein [Sinorhizobium fredii]|uniref:Uncharacterized protein n=1 Tax=Rhizobium fredii TaxID=380 RepID=A0A2L0H8J8_RHIFR|nr:hypothetical protein [Sinorhizobium fredii]AUX77825.1 hypothetical protein NXT3_CH03283 [Sinorhizobium fredii]
MHTFKGEFHGRSQVAESQLKPSNYKQSAAIRNGVEFDNRAELEAHDNGQPKAKRQDHGSQVVPSELERSNYKRPIAFRDGQPIYDRAELAAKQE